MTVSIRPSAILARTLIIAFAGLLAVSSAVRAQTTALYLDSQPGDWIGGGQQTTKTSADVTFTAVRNYRNGVQVNATQGSAFWLYFYFGAAGDGPLTVGDYTSATRFSFTKFNGLDVSGNGAGCNTITGWFRVLEVSYDTAGNVTRFAADFEQHCDNATPALFGAVRYNSTITSLVPFGGNYPLYSVTVTPSDHGTVSGDGIDCATGSPACTRTFAAPSGIALTAIPEIGYRLLSWSGDCQGGDVALLDINGPRVCTALFGPITPVAPRSALAFDSIDTPFTYPGEREYIGQGEERRYSDSNARFQVLESRDGGNYVAFWIETNDEGPWQVAFRAPSGGVLTPGEYDNATRASSSGSAAGLDFSGDGRGCNTLTGRFIVYESTFADDGTPASFAADFEQHCEGMERPLYGAIRYHSTVADVIPFGGDYPVFRLYVMPPQHGQISGGPLNCGPWDSALCTRGVSSPTAVTLTATPDPGYSATRWSGACSGTTATTPVTIDARNVFCGIGFASFHLLSFSADTTAATPFQPITWTAVASPQTDVEYEFWRRDGSTWTLVQPYGPGATYSWTPSPADAGTHAIQVWARGTASTRSYDDWRSLTFSVQPEVAPVIKTFSADHAYPLPAGGGGVTWTATVSSGSSTPEYEFWRLDADGWHMVQGYSATNTYTWTPTVADVGSHTIQVWVRNAGSTANYEAWQGTSFNVVIPALTITSLSANNTPSIGVTTTWTAQASGGIAPLQFQFWRLDADGWHMVQDYSPTAAYSWTPSLNDAGTHALQVWVKSAGSVAAYDAWRGLSFSVPVPAAPSVTIAALGVVPAAGQGSITWKATASGGIMPYQYRFWRLDADGWHIGQDYSASDTYTWSPGLSDAGTHAVQVWVRIAGSSANYDAWISTGYFVVPSAPPVLLSFSTSPPLPATAGTPLTWTATTSTPNVEYEVWRYDQGTGWRIVQAYGASATYTWIPDVSDAGTHALQIWVRRVGSSAAYDGWIGTGYFTINALN